MGRVLPTCTLNVPKDNNMPQKKKSKLSLNDVIRI